MRLLPFAHRQQSRSIAVVVLLFVLLLPFFPASVIHASKFSERQSTGDLGSHPLTGEDEHDAVFFDDDLNDDDLAGDDGGDEPGDDADF